MLRKLHPTYLLLIPLLAGCQRDDDDDEFMMCPQGYTCAPATMPMTSMTAPEATSGDEASDGGTTGDPSGVDSNGESAGADSNGGGDDECAPADNQCLGDDGIDVCGEDGKLHAVTCAYICGADRQNLGCQTNGDGIDVCFCGDPIEPCDDEGAFECGAPSAIRVCEHGAWKYVDCDASCVDGGYSGADAQEACRYDAEDDRDYCFCVESGCPYGTQRCADDEHLAFCDGDGWLSDSCESLCQGSGFSGSLGCHYIADAGGDSCGCY